MNVIGCDVSFWQGDINFDQMKLAGAEFVFVRAGQNEWKDKKFTRNWNASKQADLLRGAYWFYDYRVSPVVQANLFADMLLADRGELPPVIDCEQVPATQMPPVSEYLIVIERFIDLVEARLSREVMLYTNPNTIRNYISRVPDWLLRKPLWIAHYTNAAEPWYQPFSTWRFWQYTDKGDGKAYGVESNQIDMNRWNGSLDDLHKFAVIEKPADIYARIMALSKKVADVSGALERVSEELETIAGGV